MVKRRPKKLKLGKHYVIWFYKNKMMCKFIQPTKCGFNFLNHCFYTMLGVVDYTLIML